MPDTRLIRTAVVGRRDSTEPAYLPLDFDGAGAFLGKHQGRKFFCGVHLGGCGWPLRVRRSEFGYFVSHFAHVPDGPFCTRSTRAGHNDADHLFIYNGLIYLSRRNGGADRASGDADIVMRDGRCISIMLQHRNSAVRVQFADLAEDVWRAENGVLQRSFENIQWIFGTAAQGIAQALRTREGYVLRAQCLMREGVREVYVRMETALGASEWIPLTECTINPQGIVTGPGIDAVAIELPPPQAITAVRSRTVESVEVPPRRLLEIIADLRIAKRGDDRLRAIEILAAANDVLSGLHPDTHPRQQQIIAELRVWALEESHVLRNELMHRSRQIMDASEDSGSGRYTVSGQQLADLKQIVIKGKPLGGAFRDVESLISAVRAEIAAEVVLTRLEYLMAVCIGSRKHRNTVRRLAKNSRAWSRSDQSLNQKSKALAAAEAQVEAADAALLATETEAVRLGISQERRNRAIAAGRKNYKLQDAARRDFPAVIAGLPTIDSRHPGEEAASR